jgi:hypothetical protein
VLCQPSSVQLRNETELYMCVCGGIATWSVTLRDRYQLRVIQNMVLRMTVASKRTAAVAQFTLLTRCYLGAAVKQDVMGRACGAHWRNKTNSMEQSPCNTTSFSASQEIPHILWNVKVCCCVHKSCPCLDPYCFSPHTPIYACIIQVVSFLPVLIQKSCMYLSCFPYMQHTPPISSC